MNAFAYNDELLCEDCAEQVRTAIIAEGLEPIDSDDDSSYDSDEFPKGPQGDGGGEADCPQHCGNCGLFLENPLTTDGVQYVKQKILAADGDPDVLAEWAEFYNLKPEE